MGFFGSLFGGNCITNSAYIAAASKQAAAIAQQAAADIAIQVGVALWQRNASASISNMQTQLAEQQMQLAEEVHAHAKLFWPEEAELVADIFGEAKVTASYAGLPLNYGAMAGQSFAQARETWIDTARTLCLTPSRCEDARFQRMTMLGHVDLMSYGARQEEAREQISNDRRYARQLAVLGLSRGAVNSLISYQSVSQYSGLSAGQIIASGINSALTLYGYQRTSRDAPDGWAVGVRDSWNTEGPRMPGTGAAPSGIQIERVRPPMPGLNIDSALPRPERLPSERRWSKENEFDGADWSAF